MGQQQILLLTLSVLLVGVALLSAVNSFWIWQEQSESEQAKKEALKVAERIKVHAITPSALGGASGGSSSSSSAWPSDLREVFPNREGVSANTIVTRSVTITYKTNGDSPYSILHLFARSRSSPKGTAAAPDGPAMGTVLISRGSAPPRYSPNKVNFPIEFDPSDTDPSLWKSANGADSP